MSSQSKALVVPQRGRRRLLVSALASRLYVEEKRNFEMLGMKQQ